MGKNGMIHLTDLGNNVSTLVRVADEILRTESRPPKTTTERIRIVLTSGLRRNRSRWPIAARRAILSLRLNTK